MKALTITFTSAGRQLMMGRGSAYKLRSVQGLETSDIEITSVENAGVDGSTVTNQRLGARHIDILGGIPSGDREAYRETLVRFFNPANTGTAVIDYCGTKRKTVYHVEAVDFGVQHEQLRAEYSGVYPTVCAALPLYGGEKTDHGVPENLAADLGHQRR